SDIYHAGICTPDETAGVALNIRVLVCFPLFSLFGSVCCSVPITRTKSSISSGSASVRRQLHERLHAAPAEFAAGNFQSAAVAAESGYRDATQAREPRLAAMFLNNLGACRFALHQYRPALQAFSQACRLAESEGDRSTAGKLLLNISSLYSQLDELDAAVSSGERAITLLSPADRLRYQSHFEVQLALIRAKQGRFPEAEVLFHRGVQAADRAGDREVYASGWNNLGEEYLRRDRADQAEHALLEAYRIRKLYRLHTLDASYTTLGALFFKQDSLQTASHLLDRVIENSSRPGGLRPEWEAYYWRGLVRHKQRRLVPALEDLRVAVRLAGILRRSVPANDAARIAAENSVHEVHAALIETGDAV